ncbi:MAG: polysaccharide deacetylase family protein [bacterium]|nr:polysaccharide deacetylase family protein [bacterium]
MREKRTRKIYLLIILLAIGITGGILAGPAEAEELMKQNNQQAEIKPELQETVPRLRNEMATENLRRFKATVERQALAFPGQFFLEAPQTTGKFVALTFDDGPDSVFTPQILKLLAQHKVTATFFLPGRKIERFRETARSIKKAGHAVGGHSYDHPDLRKLTEEVAYNTQVNKTQRIFKNILGFKPAIFRPPYGAVTDRQICFFAETGLKIINWSVDTFDWDRARNSPAQIASTVLKYGHAGSIILMHSAGGDRSGTVKALPVIIKTLRRRGFQFVTVTELLGLPAELE